MKDLMRLSSGILVWELGSEIHSRAKQERPNWELSKPNLETWLSRRGLIGS